MTRRRRWEREKEEEKERAAYIALGSSRLHRINGDDITLLHTHVDARILLCTIRPARERWRTERVHSELPFNGFAFVSSSKCGLKKAAFSKGEISWDIRDTARSGCECHFIIHGWLREIADAIVYRILHNSRLLKYRENKYVCNL